MANAQPQNSGIKIAQPGWDARTCPDYQLIFSSSWPSITIAYDQVVSGTTDSFGTLSITGTHNLGFFPLTMAWQFSDSTQTLQQGRLFPNIDKTKFYISVSGTTLAANTTYYFNVKCYNLDISYPQSYTYLESASSNTAYDASYGIKVAKSKKNIYSTDLRDFILHSRAASPQVLAVITEQSLSTPITSGNSGTISFTNPQGYVPWLFAYAAFKRTDGSTYYVWAPPYSQSYPAVAINTDGKGTSTLTITYTGTALPYGSIIALRDPLFVSTYKRVTY
jgi:hypothetical protein